MTARPRVVVVGSGFGGLAAVDRLSRLPVDVTVIDRDNYHGFWPLLYQVASSELGADDIATPIRAVHRDRPNVEVRLGTVSRADLERRVVCMADGDGADVAYDHLIVACGSSTSDFGIEGVAEHAYPLKTLPDAVRLRNHVLLAFERADTVADSGGGQPTEPLSIVVVGGGTTGVEMAGALSELIRHNLSGDFTHLDLTRARVVLVEMTDHLLAGFSDRSRRAAVDTLESQGVELRLGTSIESVEEDGVTLQGGERIPAATVIWTAGVKANPLAESLPGHGERGGRVTVTPDLSLPGHPEVYVIGDMCGAKDRHGDLLPQVAQVAIQGGKHAARAIARRMAGKPTRAFRYLDHGSMATIGRRSAVAELPGGLVITGTLGWLSWLVVHLLFLVGTRNRVAVMTNWAWNYVSWDRASRVILTS